MRLLLDSAFVIDHMRGLPEAIERYRALFEAGDEPFVNEIVVCEVRAGTRDEELPDVPCLLRAGRVHPAGPADAAVLAGAWRDRATSRGYHLSLAGRLVAAAADAVDAAVLTRNVKDFALTPVRVETY